MLSFTKPWEELAMPEKEATSTAENLKQKLAQQLDAARSKIEALKKDLISLRNEDIEALREKREEIDKRLDEQKEAARKLQADIANWKEEKVAHTQEAIGSWRQRHELKKLQNRADRAEEYALDLVTVAAFDFEEAEQAVLDAVVARFDADMASSAAP
jgi:TolA-binding protein